MDFLEDIFEMFTGGHRRHDERNKKRFPHGGNDKHHDDNHYAGHDDHDGHEGRGDYIHAGNENYQGNAKICVKCRLELDAGVNFCPGCGNKAEAEKPSICPNCQGKLIAGASFCSICGLKV